MYIISSKTRSRIVWRRVRKLEGKFILTKTPSLKVGDSIVANPTDVVECLGQHFSNFSSSKNVLSATPQTGGNGQGI